jgi:hypothetical protein
VRGRAGDASEDALFERALMGEEVSQGRLFDPRRDRKTLQLCRQVERALASALAGGCGDEVLRDASVAAVEPLGGAGQLLVRLVLAEDAGVDAAEVMARLAARTPRLRAVVAADICRKRVPMLAFVVVPSMGRTGDGEGVESEISDLRFEISDEEDPHPNPLAGGRQFRSLLPEYRERGRGLIADDEDRRSREGGGREH